ncbi:nuclear pore complex component-domain-containing protein [Apiosordaria backusii]|uniref:Nuclear pore complex component-domain-containing protein n=1 Tax=Apiosordaria backusii TaxID=314023 RepID=A0AA40EHX3_9PEZI|nr:nuclear pore complex component-domain-containing protein [Apiosordaria backusii]
MLSTPVKSTPIKQITSPSPFQESPGNWKHPRLAEITARQDRTTFSQKNVIQIVYNVVAIAGVQVLRRFVLPYSPIKLEKLPYGRYIPLTLLLIPLFNILLALLPLFRPKDDLSDIPLTPAQRELLGLPPSKTPPTPASAISTPPKYSRTPSIAGSPAGSIRSYASSPLSNRSTPLGNYSPSPSKAANLVSPLLQKATQNTGRRGSFSNSLASSTMSFASSTTSNGSFGSSTMSGGPAFSESVQNSLLGTPTPVNGKRSSVALNSKWLYERGRRGSSNSWLHQGGF